MDKWRVTKMTPQELIENALEIAHRENGYSLWDIKEALENVLKDVNYEIEQCKIDSKGNL